MTVEQGELARFADRHTLVYDRRYPHPIDLVWEAVSTGEHLSVWLLPVTRVERRAGGRATFTWGGPEEDGVETYLVRDFEPPRRITFVAEGLPAFMRFDLEPDGDAATLLHFTLYWPVPAGTTLDDEAWPGGDLPAGPDTAWRPGHVAGFHQMLDQLAGFLRGEWSAADASAAIDRILAGAANAEHDRWIDVYRDHIAAQCPPA